MDPDAPRPFYLPPLRQNKKGEEQAPDKVGKLIEAVLLIDRAARMLIKLGLKSAARKASTESTKVFLDEALSNERVGDTEAIRLLLVSTNRDRGGESDALRSAAIERLENEVATLDQLSAIIRDVRPGFVKALKKLRKTQPKRKTKAAAR